jgi:SAM-dependent methyltransferase
MINAKKNNKSSTVNFYGKDYLNWKNWGDDFAKINDTDIAYYSAEISRLHLKDFRRFKVLEIGFGNGHFLEYARQMGWDVCGTEINEDLVSIAKQSGFKAKHVANLSEFDESSFDLVVAFDVLEHIPQDILPKLMLEVNRALKSDGFFIARFPNGDSPLGLMHQNSDITHVTNIGSGKIRYYAEKANFQIHFIGGAAQPFFGAGYLQLIYRLITIPIKKLINLFSYICNLK